MFNVVVKNNIGIVLAKAPCCMTLEQAQNFADSFAMEYRRNNVIRHESSGVTLYPYVSIVIIAGTAKWWKWYPLSGNIAYSEC